jgi:hypothetical protein
MRETPNRVKRIVVGSSSTCPFKNLTKSIVLGIGSVKYLKERNSSFLVGGIHKVGPKRWGFKINILGVGRRIQTLLH